MTTTPTLITYIELVIIIIARAISYIFIIRNFSKHISPTKSPFNFSKKFITDTEKFSLVYVFWDILLLLFEWFFIIWFKNAIILRIISVILLLTTAGFFWRFRTRIRNKILKKNIKSNFIKLYLADTIPSLIFRTPIYIGKLCIFAFFGLVTWPKIFAWIIISLLSVTLFGRIACRIADITEKLLIKKWWKKYRKTNKQTHK